MKLAVYFLKIQTIATDNSLKPLLSFPVGLPRWEICDWKGYYCKIAVALEGFIFVEVAF